MACFAVPMAEAIVMTAATAVVKSREKKSAALKNGTEKAEHSLEAGGGIPWSRKLRWLTNLLWGGSFLLAYEHVWHGEVVPWFPFLTAAGNPADAATMLHEMSTVGVTMAVLVTAAWACMVLVTGAIAKRVSQKELAARRGGNV